MQVSTSADEAAEATREYQELTIANEEGDAGEEEEEEAEDNTQRASIGEPPGQRKQV